MGRPPRLTEASKILEYLRVIASHLKVKWARSRDEVADSFHGTPVQAGCQVRFGETFVRRFVMIDQAQHHSLHSPFIRL
jgi:hypothetical protein